ncbi:hypothetical protein R1sor_007968 [Riccia sorocarpa]|uniref:PI3K/PI4K catalytic domain-containing protein n=1 Tax=Riccia sorocarpa TaxID=122646 RepID=A0ABD3HVG8_9MARC
MGTRIQTLSYLSSSSSSSCVAEIHPSTEGFFTSTSNSHHHVTVSKQPSVHLSSSQFSKQQVLRDRLKKSSSAGDCQITLDLCFPFKAGVQPRSRKFGVLCSSINSLLPSSSSPSPSSSSSKDSTSTHSLALPPPSALSHGSTLISGAPTQSLVDTVAAADGSFLESVTRPEDLDLTGGGELSLRIIDGLDDLNGNFLDPELQGILANIADMQRQNEMLTEQMKEFQVLLTKTTRSLNVKAQEAKIEAAKLKKLAKAHQLDEIRRAEDLRRKVLEARIQEELKERTSLEDAYRRRQIWEDDSAGPAAEQISSQLEAVEEVAQQERKLGQQSSTSTSNTETRIEEVLGVPESLECSMLHPGALSCTKTIIKSDPAGKSAQVTIETTVSCAGDACLLTSLNGDDYVALAVQTLADAARELKTSRFQRATDADPVQHARHKEIEEILSTGRIVKARPMEPPSKFGHESFVVQLKKKQTGQKVDAMCKPGIEGHADGWHRAAIELVAYELNLMLGMDYVPPVAYRSGGVDVNYKHYNDGAFVYYVPNTVPLKKVPATQWGVSVAMLLSDTRILDVLLNNSDRHHGHFLFGEHWADGRMRPILIDHAAGFRKEAVVKMDHENAFQTGPVRCVSSRTYLRLRFLEKQRIQDKFKGILSSDEVNKMMQRRDMILSYLDALVAERGYHKTVIET